MTKNVIEGLDRTTSCGGRSCKDCLFHMSNNNKKVNDCEQYGTGAILELYRRVKNKYKTISTTGVIEEWEE